MDRKHALALYVTLVSLYALTEEKEEERKEEEERKKEKKKRRNLYVVR